MPALLTCVDLWRGCEAARYEAGKESATKEKHMIAILLVTLLGSADVLVAEGKPEPTHEAFMTTFALMELYSYQPFHPSSAMPDHLWMAVHRRGGVSC